MNARVHTPYELLQKQVNELLADVAMLKIVVRQLEQKLRDRDHEWDDFIADGYRPTSS